MDSSTIIKVGETVSEEHLVEMKDTAHVLGNDGVTMLSTPAMIIFMEQTAAGIILKRASESYRPVGIEINVKHINPTPVGEKVTVNAIVTHIDGPKVTFDVEARNKKFKIGYGEYRVHVIDLEKYKDRF